MIKMVVVKQQNLGSWSLRFTQSHATRKYGPWKAPVIDFNPLENWIDSASGLPNQIVLGPIESQPAHQRSPRLTRGSSRFDIIAAPISADHHQDLPPDGPKKTLQLEINQPYFEDFRSYAPSGWWYTYPKNMSSSVGVTTFPIWWESQSKFHGSSHHQPDHHIYFGDFPSHVSFTGPPVLPEIRQAKK